MKKARIILAFILAALAALSLISCNVNVNVANTEDEKTKDASVSPTTAESPAAVDYDYADVYNVEYFYNCQVIRYDFSQGKYASYKGKRVHLCGTYQTNGYHFIVFSDPSACCSAVDFEILYNGAYPAAGTPIEITGTFDYYSDDYGTYPCIDVESMKVLS